MFDENMMKCILCMPTSHRLHADAEKIVSKNFELVAISASEDPVAEDEFLDLGCEIVISFLNSYIFKNHALSLPNVNFHPSTPSYPGIAGASRALYDGVSSFGVTAHQIVAQIDAGKIFKVKTFPIEAGDDSQMLRHKAEVVALELLDEISAHVKTYGTLPDPCDENWTGQVMTNRQFQQWMVLDPDDPDDFQRKVRAIRHPDFDGPYIDVHGHRFALSN